MLLPSRWHSSEQMHDGALAVPFIFKDIQACFGRCLSLSRRTSSLLLARMQMLRPFLSAEDNPMSYEGRASFALLPWKFTFFFRSHIYQDGTAMFGFSENFLQMIILLKLIFFPTHFHNILYEILDQMYLPLYYILTFG
mmetsp:Transcript_22718/g.52078  ORF Transcript_22718/g.52078 Transcript_22718/m.52078 type:complete len:139 (-) Transcript_22718:155-571(-)